MRAGVARLAPASALAALTLGAAFAAAAPAQDVATGFVARLEGARATSGGAPGPFCAQIAATILDLAAMADAASGRTLSRMDAQQQARYLRAFRRRVGEACVSQVAPYLRGRLEATGARRRADGAYDVGVRATGEGAPTADVLWRLRAPDGPHPVIDVFVGGRSALRDAGADARAVLERSGGDVEAVVRAIE